MKRLPAFLASTTFLAAFLLFFLEPMVARRLLPLFGGSAAVWATCLVFFQCALLAGYLYAHLLITRLPPRKQAAVHVLLLTAAILSLAADLHPGEDAMTHHPLATLLWLLTAASGLPFLALAATSPLLQAWRSRSTGADLPPWWLYALSNAGSLLALLVYPTLVEPHLTLRAQSAIWAVGFCAFAALMGALALHHRRAPALLVAREDRVALESHKSNRLLWVLLPASASMLLCAVTNHLGENIAAIPLLWILPLAAYLLSFVVAFASPRAWPRFISVRMLAVTLATFAYLLYNSRYTFPLAVSVPTYLAALLFACLFCHAELYRLRPSAAELTGFYLWVAFGSALGAVWIGLAAPALFHANHDLAISVIVLALAALVANWRSGWPARAAWAAASLALVFIALAQDAAMGQDAIAQLRGFYGSLRVTETHLPPEAETTRTLYHGSIQHGTQLFGNGLRTEPASYYGRHSGVGLALDLCCLDPTGHPRPRRIGVVGLGTGSVAAYGKPGDEIVFYEIDPLVERLARALFTYLRDSTANVRIVLGDARLSIGRLSIGHLSSSRLPVARPSAGRLPIAPEKNSPPYDVLVLDAFSGDAVPVHLLTAPAIALYRRHLQPNGILAIHISSQYLDLAPQLTLQARNAGLAAVVVHTDANEDRGLFAADWVLMTADRSFLQLPEIVNASQPLPDPSGLRLWTDDYSSLLPLLKWSAATSPRQIVKP